MTVSTLGIYQYTGESGSHSHQYSIAKNVTGNTPHSHALDFQSNTNISTSYNNPDNHSHTVSVPNKTGGFNDGSHSHSIEYDSGTTEEKGSHSHTLPSNLVTGVKAEIKNYDHTHDIDISHGHDIYMGIIEGDKPSGMKLTWSEGQYTNQISVASEGLYTININSRKGGWKSIQIKSDTLGRVQLQVICKLRIDTATN